MPHIERSADIVWVGNLARGTGLITAGSSGAFEALPYSAATRVGSPEGQTSPEELLAAAHGGCLTMSLVSELTGLGNPPGRIAVSCRIMMDEVEGQGHQITGSIVTIAANVPGLDRATLDGAVERADEGCPFSALLRRAGATVDVSATLAD